jgi:hypothetical protein
MGGRGMEDLRQAQIFALLLIKPILHRGDCQPDRYYRLWLIFRYVYSIIVHLPFFE